MQDCIYLAHTLSVCVSSRTANTHYVILLKYKWDDFIRGENVCNPPTNQPTTERESERVSVITLVHADMLARPLACLCNSIENYGVNLYLALIIAFFHSLFFCLFLHRSYHFTIKILHTELHRLSNENAFCWLGHSLIQFRRDGWLYIVSNTTFTKNTTALGQFFSLFLSLRLPLFRHMIIRVRNATCALCVCVCMCLLNKSAAFLGFFLTLSSVPRLFVCCRLPIYFALICFYFNFVFCCASAFMRLVYGGSTYEMSVARPKLIRGNLSTTITIQQQQQQRQRQQLK